MIIENHVQLYEYILNLCKKEKDVNSSSVDIPERKYNYDDYINQTYVDCYDLLPVDSEKVDKAYDTLCHTRFRNRISGRKLALSNEYFYFNLSEDYEVSYNESDTFTYLSSLFSNHKYFQTITIEKKHGNSKF